MNILKEYDVLRLIGHNQICYVSSENVKGCSMANWVRLHPVLAKDTMFRWIRTMIQQLIQIHKCRGNPSYRYVNPYSMIISEDERVYFLDTSADSNKEQLTLMQRRDVREFFLPKQENDYDNSSEELDLYGLGKTIQFLLAFTEVTPSLTWREERICRKLLMQCFKKNKKITDIQKYLPELN